jgi:hypothetical protein
MTFSQRSPKSPNRRLRTQLGAATAEYTAVTAAGCGFAGVLIALLKSDFMQNLLKTIFTAILHMIGLG